MSKVAVIVGILLGFVMAWAFVSMIKSGGEALHEARVSLQQAAEERQRLSQLYNTELESGETIRCINGWAVLDRGYQAAALYLKGPDGNDVPCSPQHEMDQDVFQY